MKVSIIILVLQDPVNWIKKIKIKLENRISQLKFKFFVKDYQSVPI